MLGGKPDPVKANAKPGMCLLSRVQTLPVLQGACPNSGVQVCWSAGAGFVAAQHPRLARKLCARRGASLGTVQRFPAGAAGGSSLPAAESETMFVEKTV